MGSMFCQNNCCGAVRLLVLCCVKVFMHRVVLIFLIKMNIALKEAYETEYWISLLHDTGYLSDDIYSSIYADSVELVRLLTSTVKTLKDSLGRQ